MHFMWLNKQFSLLRTFGTLKGFAVCHSACLLPCPARSTRSSGVCAAVSYLIKVLAFVLSSCVAALLWKACVGPKPVF